MKKKTIKAWIDIDKYTNKPLVTENTKEFFVYKTKTNSMRDKYEDSKVVLCEIVFNH